jgi:hypothetical protein
MSAGALTLLVVIVAFVALGGGLLIALIPVLQHVAAGLAR